MKSKKLQANPKRSDEDKAKMKSFVKSEPIKTVDGFIKASDIIRQKLIDCGGKAIYHNSRKEHEFFYDGSKDAFCSPTGLGNGKFELAIFDVVVDLMIEQGGKGLKGNARSGDKLGFGANRIDTIDGVIAYRHDGTKIGTASFGYFSAVLPIMEWAEIVVIHRGYAELSNKYLSMIKA